MRHSPVYKTGASRKECRASLVTQTAAVILAGSVSTKLTPSTASSTSDLGEAVRGSTSIATIGSSLTTVPTSPKPARSLPSSEAMMQADRAGRRNFPSPLSLKLFRRAFSGGSLQEGAQRDYESPERAPSSSLPSTPMLESRKAVRKTSLPTLMENIAISTCGETTLLSRTSTSANLSLAAQCRWRGKEADYNNSDSSSVESCASAASSLTRITLSGDDCGGRSKIGVVNADTAAKKNIPAALVATPPKLTISNHNSRNTSRTTSGSSSWTFKEGCIDDDVSVPPHRLEKSPKLTQWIGDARGLTRTIISSLQLGVSAGDLFNLLLKDHPRELGNFACRLSELVRKGGMSPSFQAALASLLAESHVPKAIAKMLTEEALQAHVRFLLTLLNSPNPQTIVVRPFLACHPLGEPHQRAVILATELIEAVSRSRLALTGAVKKLLTDALTVVKTHIVQSLDAASSLTCEFRNSGTTDEKKTENDSSSTALEQTGKSSQMTTPLSNDVIYLLRQMRGAVAAQLPEICSAGSESASSEIPNVFADEADTVSSVSLDALSFSSTASSRTGVNRNEWVTESAF